MKNNSKAKSTNKKTVERKKIKQEPNEHKALRDLFIAELKDIYWAEKALMKAVPKMIKNVTSEELSEAFTGYLDTTKEQVTRLEKVFSLLNEKAIAKKCESMTGLIKETEEIMKANEKGPVRDAGIILAGQKIEHYQIATYGTLAAFAKIIGEHETETLLKETLEEEKEVDEKLSEIAEFSINVKATSINDKNSTAIAA